MKKIIITTVILFSAFYGFSQENDHRDKMQFGLKIGTNYSNVYDALGEEFNTDAKFGFVGGAYLAIPIGTYLGVQPELLISQKGFSATGKILGNTYEFKRTTSFVDIPLMFSFKPSPYVSIVAGPEYSYLINQKDQFTSSEFSFVQEQEVKNENISKNILSFIGGVDVNYERFVIGGRVGWDITHNNGDGTSNTPRYKNVWYQLTMGFRFY